MLRRVDDVAGVICGEARHGGTEGGRLRVLQIVLVIHVGGGAVETQEAAADERRDLGSICEIHGLAQAQVPAFAPVGSHVRQTCRELMKFEWSSLEQGWGSIPCWGTTSTVTSY
ncbi:hypothetical protein JOM56_009112 [Amanita muscaria]